MICVQPPCRQENQGAGSKNTCPLVRYLGENTGVMTDPPPQLSKAADSDSYFSQRMTPGVTLLPWVPWSRWSFWMQNQASGRTAQGIMDGNFHVVKSLYHSSAIL